MALSTKKAEILIVAVAIVALLALILGGCGGSTAASTTSSGQTTSTTAKSTSPESTSTNGTSQQSTTTTGAPSGAANVTASIGQAMVVEQGHLTVSKVTVADNLASAAANALLLTGASGEKKNASKAAGSGNEFLMITFAYEKDASYPFRGGLYPDDITLKDSTGKVYQLVQTAGYGGIFQSNAGSVKPGVEAQTTAVYEVPKGLKGLSLIYHQRDPDGFTCSIR